MRILLAVASAHGSTREIAAAIMDELRAAALSVDMADADAVDDLSPYGAVILGSAVYAGHWLPAASQFAARHRDALASRPLWVFSSGPIAALAPPSPHELHQLAVPLAALPVRDHQLFGGKLDRQNLGLIERVIALVVRAPSGDFRDWDAIHSWARTIAASLCDQPAGAAGDSARAAGEEAP
ncbi:MAG TPA: flavodoxin domain-containing protein [Herpetosiphonaceae bacterium]